VKGTFENGFGEEEEEGKIKTVKEINRKIRKDGQ
jgi:hypothetical protein